MAAAAAVAAGHCSKPRRAQVEAPAQSNSNGLIMSDDAAAARRQQSAQNQRRHAEAAKRSELSFSNSLQHTRAERPQSNAPAGKRQQSLTRSASSKQIQAVDKFQRRLPPPPPPPPPPTSSQAVARSGFAAPKAPADRPKFAARRQPQVARNENNLRHWSSAAGPLEESPHRSRRPLLVGLQCKSLLQLNDAAGRHTCRARHQDASQSARQLPARLKQVLAVSAAASQVTQARRPRAATSAAAAVSSEAPKPFASAKRALLLSKAAPKRALSCNQLAARCLSEQPKIAKTTASPAVTNSRLRRGLLFARRQCQLAPPFSSVEDLRAPPLISRRVSHLAPRIDSQHFDKAITRLTATATTTTAAAAAKSRQVAASRLVTKKASIASAAAPTSKAIGRTEGSISRPGGNTRKLVATASACTPKRSLDVARLHLHRRWSSLESSNQDDDEELTSSPSSSSSSILSGADTACLLLTASRALDYLAPGSTGCTLINQQAAEKERQLGRRRSSSQRRAAAAADQTRRPNKPQTTRSTSEQHDNIDDNNKDGDTRRIEPAPQGHCKSEFAVDEISNDLESSREQQHCQLTENSADILLKRANCEHINEDQARGSHCEPLDIVDIVVKQPKRDCHFDTKPTPAGRRDHSLPLEPASRRECSNRALESSPAVSDIPTKNVNDTEFMLLVDQPNQNKQFAEPGLEGCVRQADQHQAADGFRGIHSETINSSLASSGALPNSIAVAPVKDQDKMMISADHRDTRETSQRWPTTEEANMDNNNYQVPLENVPDLINAHHQPLTPLQTINCEQRGQPQSRENSDSNTNGLKAALVASQKQLTSQKAAFIPIRQEPIHDYYDLEPRPFARGKFAQVKRCVKIDTKECFAAKCIKKRRRLVDIRHEILLEIEALKLSSRTEHIVKLYEVYETPNEMILILEMAGGGELQRVLDDEESIDEPLVRKMVRQILEGLIYLHDDQIVHLDLKPQNLLLTKPFPNGDIKLCDFGISRRITECEIREICGTPDYTAPEVLQYDPISLNTDMWSLGVVTYVLLSGYSPFGSENKQQTFCNITTCSLDFPSELFENVSSDAIDFVRKLIVLEPSQRLTSRQALSHRWFSQ